VRKQCAVERCALNTTGISGNNKSCGKSPGGQWNSWCSLLSLFWRQWHWGDHGPWHQTPSLVFHWKYSGWTPGQHVACVITSHHIAHYVPSLDPELVKMTIEREMCHINTKTYVQYKWNFHIRDPKKTVVTHTSIWRYIHIYDVWLLNNAIAHTLPGKHVGVRSEWKAIELEASQVEQDCCWYLVLGYNELVEWLIQGDVFKTRDLLPIGWCLRPLAMADFQLHKLLSLQTKLCGISQSVLWQSQYTCHLRCYLLEASTNFLCYIIGEVPRIIRLYMNSYSICASPYFSDFHTYLPRCPQLPLFYWFQNKIILRME
jgi:hypothetical protein